MNLCESLEVMNVCRICFQNIQECKYVCLFSEEAESEEIIKMFATCFQIILTPNKHSPSFICKLCIKQLRIANNFKLQCLGAIERFTKYCELTPLQDDFTNDDSSCLIENKDNKLCEVTENYKNLFKCDKCNKKVKTRQSLIKHKTLMHVRKKHGGKAIGHGPTRRYHCTNCIYSTPHSQTLVNHMRRHNGDRPFSCECGKNFTQMSSLTAHKKTHSTATFFTCQQCGKQLKHAFSLKNHLRVHEDGIYCCNICKKLLKSKDSLRSHIRRHYKVFNYNCEECGDTFVTSAELYNHKTKHVSDKHNCNICDYTTKSKKNLTLHLKRHNGDKTFTCNYCDKTFFTQADTNRHMRVHTREKPYSCQTCAQKFAYSSSLNKHMLTVHGIKFKWSETKFKESRTHLDSNLLTKSETKSNIS